MCMYITSSVIQECCRVLYVPHEYWNIQDLSVLDGQSDRINPNGEHGEYVNDLFSGYGE